MKFKSKELTPGDKQYFTLDQWYELQAGKEVDVENIPPRFRKQNKKSKETE